MNAKTLTTAVVAPSTTRQEMILQYYPLVRTIAGRLIRRLPPSVDVEELVNVGVIGLIDALDRFDEARGVPFKAYAEIRIQGSMVDSLRHDDWVPRSVRRKFNKLEAVRNDLSSELGRAPERHEVIARLDTTEEAYEAMVKDSTIKRLVSLDVSTTDDGSTPLVECVASSEEAIDANLFDKEMRKEVAHAVECLPQKERAAVTLYYMQGLTLREIGERLGVTESRACQLRGQGVKRLQFRLRSLHG
jgi:RNA polymerase sigma factor for flagellar operon FliA